MRNQWLSKLVLVVALLTSMSCGAAGRHVTLVRDGQPMATIVVADEPMRLHVDVKQDEPTVMRAAEELQYFIAQSSGAMLPIVKASEAPADGTLVLVGRSALTQQYKLATPAASEGLQVRTFARGLAILGEVAAKGVNNVPYELDRGTLYGVYEFLERQLGYRFYIHIKDDPLFGIVVPKHEAITVPADCSLELSPDFPHRAAGFATWSEPLNWQRVTREGSTTLFVGNHTDEQVGQHYGKEHPELMALKKDGTRDDRFLCYTEPRLLELRLENIERFNEQGSWGLGWTYPNERYIPFVPADWNNEPCYSPGCRALLHDDRGPFGRDSDVVFTHGVQLAAKVKEHWPEKRVSMLAYHSYMLPPDVELPDNIDVMVCPMWSVSNGKEPYIHERHMKLMRDWSAKLGGRRDRLFVWNYYCWPAQWTEAPTMYPNYLKRWLIETHHLQSGEFVNPGSNPPQYEIFMAWLWHRLLWDRHADVDALRRDLTTNFFGPAAAPMDDLLVHLIDRWENVKWSQRIEHVYVPQELIYLETFPPESIERIRALLEAAREAARKTAPEDERDIYRRRVAWMIEGFQPFLREAELLQHWLAHPQRYEVAPADGEIDWSAHAPVELVEGKNGEAASVATRVAIAQLKHTLHIRVAASDPTPIRDDDSLHLVVDLGDDRVKALKITPSHKEVISEGDAEPLVGKLSSNEIVDGTWVIELAIERPELGVEGSGEAVVRAQFVRYRAAREGAPRDWRGRPQGTWYYWTPPIAPRWHKIPRTGTLVLPATK